MVETVTAPLLFAVANGEVGLSAKSLDCLFNDRFGLASIFLIGRNSWSGFGCFRRSL